MSIDWEKLSTELRASITIVSSSGGILSALNIIQVDNRWYSAISRLPTRKIEASL